MSIERQRILVAGVEVYEYKPHPQVQVDLVDRYPSLAANNPIFALHAKSMVVDGEHIFIGTFNLGPRSANLNTEVGALLSTVALGRQPQQSIMVDMQPKNSWRISREQKPDAEAG